MVDYSEFDDLLRVMNIIKTKAKMLRENRGYVRYEETFSIRDWPVRSRRLMRQGSTIGVN
jgi:hypothetical protein